MIRVYNDYETVSRAAAGFFAWQAEQRLVEEDPEKEVKRNERARE
jgi:hypothetical protein